MTVAVALGALVAFGLFAIHGDHLPRLSYEAWRVIARHPYSSAMQARLLGPLLVLAASKTTRVDWYPAYRETFGTLAALGVVVAALALRRWSGSWRVALAYAAAQGAAVLVVQDPMWLHLWDLIDVVLWSLVAYAIATDMSPSWFLALYAVGLGNHESALFISLWLMISALPRAEPRGEKSFDRVRFAIGAGTLLLGIVAIRVTRSALYLGDPAPYRMVTPWGNHVKLRHNAYALYHGVVTGNARVLIVYAALAATALWIVHVRSRLSGELRRVPWLLACMAVSVVAFGLVLETRSWMPTIPLLAFMHAAIRQPRPGSAPA